MAGSAAPYQAARAPRPAEAPSRGALPHRGSCRRPALASLLRHLRQPHAACPPQLPPDRVKFQDGRSKAELFNTLHGRLQNNTYSMPLPHVPTASRSHAVPCIVQEAAADLPQREGFCRRATVAAQERQSMEALPFSERLLHKFQSGLQVPTNLAHVSPYVITHPTMCCDRDISAATFYTTSEQLLPCTGAGMPTVN